MSFTTFSLDHSGYQDDDLVLTILQYKPTKKKSVKDEYFDQFPVVYITDILYCTKVN